MYYRYKNIYITVIFLYLTILFSGQQINVVIEFIQNKSLDFLVKTNHPVNNALIFLINQNT